MVTGAKLRGLGALATVRHAILVRSESAIPPDTWRGTPTESAPGLFARVIGPVLPLRKHAAAHPDRPRPAPVARQRQRDEARVLEESMTESFDAEWLLDTDSNLSYRRRGVGIDVVRKLRRGVWLIQSQLDLHGLRRDAARARLGEFIQEAANAGLRCVRVIHGKGNGSPGREGVLKAMVKGWLVRHDQVIAFAQARATDGGHGALLVLLRPTRGTRPAPRRA